MRKKGENSANLAGKTLGFHPTDIMISRFGVESQNRPWP
jgi:hypothetical protein